jgi:hypothetical protein
MVVDFDNWCLQYWFLVTYSLEGYEAERERYETVCKLVHVIGIYLL